MFKYMFFFSFIYYIYIYKQTSTHLGYSQGRLHPNLKKENQRMNGQEKWRGRRKQAHGIRL
jgi:hypothetical protein